MRADLDPGIAAARHTQEVNQALKKIGGSSPTDATWAYEACTRISGGHSLANELKGINRFIHGAPDHGLTLEARLISNPKKRAEIALDTVALAQDPARCPHEIWGLPAKPQGPSVWLWRPRQVSSPGWNEGVLIDGITDGTSTLLRVMTDQSTEGYPVLLERAKPTDPWRETMPDASGRVDTFGTPLQATIGAYSRTGVLAGVTDASKKTLAASTLRPLTATELTQIHTALPGGHILGPDATDKIMDIVKGMSGMMVIGAAPTPTAPVVPASLWTARVTQGRRFAWGQSIPLADLADYEALKANTGTTSGNAMDVFSSLFNPQNQRNRAVAAAIIGELAMGKTREEALAEAEKSVDGQAPRKAPRKPRGMGGPFG